jgi:peptidoglycan/xylan/chitin deacetylase (PgdA/CDA1 family)
VRRKAGKGALILTFHRLVDDDIRYLYKAPTVQTHVRLFEQVLESIARHYRVIDLDTLTNHLVEDRPFARDSIAVVFDDGYEDNFRLGMPLCARYGVPAALYVATGCLAGAGNGLLWGDRLEQALLTTRRASLDTVDLGMKGGKRLDLGNERDLLRANVELGRAAKPLAPGPRNALLTRLEHALEVDPSTYRRTMLTWDEVRGLAAAGWKIGSHGVSHTIMTQLPYAEACSELRISKRQLEAQIRRPVSHFAFPNGNPEDFNQELIAACAQIGYRSVASCINGLNRPGGDPLCLRRVGVTQTVQRTLLALEHYFMSNA